jgi:hypothetical protein
MYNVHIEPPSPAERLISSVTLKLHAAPDAIPAALRRALGELGATFPVEIVEILDGDDHPVEVEPPAVVSQTTAKLTVIANGCKIVVAADTPPNPGDPLWVHIQSGSPDAGDQAVLVAAADVFERALSAVGTVVERSANF